MTDAENIQTAGDVLIDACYGASVRGGWWHDGWWHDINTGAKLERNAGELIALAHSELSEALEGVRKGKMGEHLPHRKSEEVEMADAVIRIADYCGGRNLDLGGAIAEKLAYNAQRADHKLEARQAVGGKKF